MHHICSNQLHFPPKDQLQFLLENYTAISDPLLREKKITDIFANAFGGRIRSPYGLRANIRLILEANDDEICPQNYKHNFTLFNKVLTDIGKKYSSQ